MIFDIHIENKFFPWQKIDSNDITIWVKGNIFYNNILLKQTEIIQIVEEILNKGKINDVLLNLNGSYALVIKTSEIIMSIVDRVRSIPLFYSKTADRFIISDDANYIRDATDAKFNEINGAEFLVTGYVTGSETLFENIFQIQAGEYILFEINRNNLSATRYFHFWHGDYYSDPEDILLERLDDVFISVFKRLIDSTKGKQIVVPLSGGLDSRIIVAMLKRLGVKDVICYSYGKKGNLEAEISRSVANALGYKWYFVEYTNKMWYNVYHSKEMREYERYAGNNSSLPVIQDYLAVKKLKEKDFLKTNAVIIPGHSGDMLAGSWIPNNIAIISPDENQYINLILSTHYSLWKWNNEKNKNNHLFIKKIKIGIDNYSIYDINSLVNSIESFNFYERQAKFIINSVRAYEFFGYEWRIPLWDNELIDYFLKLEIKFRIDQYLYQHYILKNVILNNFTELINIPSTSITNNHSLFKDSLVKKLQKYNFLKSIIKILFYKYMVLSEYSTNPNNFYGIMSKKEYRSFYHGTENINTYLTNNYLKHHLDIENPITLLIVL